VHPTLIVTIFELAIVLIVLRIVTGKKSFVPKLSSGIIRLSVGVLSASGAYSIMTYCTQKYGRLCHEELIAGTFFTFSLLALCLIPLGVIQTLWFLLRRTSDNMKDNAT
jgi:hypothetical protein